MPPTDSICKDCGYIDTPKNTLRGSFAMAVFLWLFGIIPGFIYTIWRLTTAYKGCRKCGRDSVIPLDSPEGLRLSEQYAGRISVHRKGPKKVIGGIVIEE